MPRPRISHQQAALSQAESSGTLPTGLDCLSASCLGKLTAPLAPRTREAPVRVVPGAFPMLGVRLDSPLRQPRLSGMSIELLRKRLSADRPIFIEPCLPSPADKPPSGANWIHEIKHDGFRLMARRDPVGIRLIT
jgi:ATP-dependent DNA ligase